MKHHINSEKLSMVSPERSGKPEARSSPPGAPSLLGSPLCRSSGRRTGAGTPRTTGTTSWGSAWPELSGYGGHCAGLNRSLTGSRHPGVGRTHVSGRPVLVANREGSGRLSHSGFKRGGVRRASRDQYTFKSLSLDEHAPFIRIGTNSSPTSASRPQRRAVEEHESFRRKFEEALVKIL